MIYFLYRDCEAISWVSEIHFKTEKIMAELKTKLNNASVDEFITSIKDEQKRADCFQIAEIMKKVTKAGPKM